MKPNCSMSVWGVFPICILDKQLGRKPASVSSTCLKKVWWSIQLWRCDKCCITGTGGGGRRGSKSRQWSIGGELGKSKFLCYRLSLKNSFINCLTFTSKCIRVHLRWTLSWKNIATLIKVSEVFSALHGIDFWWSNYYLSWWWYLNWKWESRDLFFKVSRFAHRNQTDFHWKGDCVECAEVAHTHQN